MRSDLINANLAFEFEEFGYAPLPNSIVDSHKLPMDVSGDEWQFNTSSHYGSHTFQDQGQNVWLQYSIRHYLIQSVQRISPSEAHNMAGDIQSLLQKTVAWTRLAAADSIDASRKALPDALSELLELLQSTLRAYRFSRVRAWYLWCTDHIPEMGFDPDYSYRLMIVSVPRNESGQAVRSEHVEEGPLSDDELLMLRQAMLDDKSMVYGHICERAAVGVTLAFGRNAANYVLSRRCDLERRPVGPGKSLMMTWNIPRIKKRTLPRMRFKREHIDEGLAHILDELIKAAPKAPGVDERDRPLFARANPRLNSIGTHREEWAYHLTAVEFTQLLRAASDRYNLISPRTGELLKLSTRRLRYTFATNMVRMGVSLKQLAELLDHSSTNHVNVYFDARHTIVERLNAAAAKAMGPLFKLFRGAVSPREDPAGALAHANAIRTIRIMPELAVKGAQLESIGLCGQNNLCSLYPPYSCYSCPRFRPYDDSIEVHERILTYLIAKRDKYLDVGKEMSRIAVQLDEVIYACAELINRLEARAAEHPSSETDDSSASTPIKDLPR